MNFDLTELAATLAIGVFALVGAVWAYLLPSNRTVGSVFTDLSNMSQYFIAVIAAGCFVVGMILEDVSNKFVDDRDENNWFSARILESDHEIKTRVFFGDNYRQSIHEASLSYLAARYGLLGNYAGADGAALQSHILLKHRCEPVKKAQQLPQTVQQLTEKVQQLNEKLERLDEKPQQLTVKVQQLIEQVQHLTEKPKQFQEVQLNEKMTKEVAKAFYYNAKSFSYKDGSYYNELKKIQMRIDFSRSLIAVLVLIVVFFIAGLMVRLFKELLIWQPWIVNWVCRLRSKLTRKENGETSWSDKANAILKRLRKDRVRSTSETPGNIEQDSLARIGRALAIFLMLGVLFFAASFAYSSEEEEFDKRAYGYYIYSKVNSEQPVICEELPRPQANPGPATTIAVSDPH